LKIQGIEKLNEEQKALMLSVNKLHTDCVGNDYKDGMEIKKVWVDEKGIVCVRLKNGEWYHYTNNQKWY